MVLVFGQLGLDNWAFGRFWGALTQLLDLGFHHPGKKRPTRVNRKMVLVGIGNVFVHSSFNTDWGANACVGWFCSQLHNW
jgi:hypothetical protein